ncbi:MAG TPA: hypothetical protein PKC24_14260 [Cyclobacteriaceae bacterium]|nr:hypothetical protein [Cyclobacteriaceae bacterium]
MKRVNGGFAIYYGISIVIGAIAVLFGIGVWLYKVFINETEFSWGTLIALLVLSGVVGIIGYIILRVGYEQIEE